MLGRAGKVDQAFLPNHREPHLLGRFVFTLTRMTSQPSLLNMGRPVSSSCRSRLVAVMFRTTMISMFPPMKLEVGGRQTSGHHCHCGHNLSLSERGKGWETMPWDRKRDGTCPRSHNQPFLSSLALVNSYTSFKTLLCSAVIISPKPFLIPSPYTLSIFLLSQANLSVCDYLCLGLFPIKGRKQLCIISDRSMVHSRYSINGHIRVRQSPFLLFSLPYSPLASDGHARGHTLEDAHPRREVHCDDRQQHILHFQTGRGRHLSSESWTGETPQRTPPPLCWEALGKSPIPCHRDKPISGAVVKRKRKAEHEPVCTQKALLVG